MPRVRWLRAANQLGDEGVAAVLLATDVSVWATMFSPNQAFVSRPAMVRRNRAASRAGALSVYGNGAWKEKRYSSPTKRVGR